MISPHVPPRFVRRGPQHGYRLFLPVGNNCSAPPFQMEDKNWKGPMKYQHKRPSVPSRLGIGPMSRNVVDAAIRMEYRHHRPVMVIASRSQVECGDLGGGYVERWSTEQFTNYIRSQDPAGLVRICRDHGGPWQHPNE